MTIHQGGRTGQCRLIVWLARGIISASFIVTYFFLIPLIFSVLLLLRTFLYHFFFFPFPLALVFYLSWFYFHPFSFGTVQCLVRCAFFVHVGLYIYTVTSFCNIFPLVLYPCFLFFYMVFISVRFMSVCSYKIFYNLCLTILQVAMERLRQQEPHQTYLSSHNSLSWPKK